jgi:hypothetical protein
MKGASPVPSTMVPPRIIRSRTIVLPLGSQCSMG